MTKTWATHLIRAIDDDDVATTTDKSSDSDPHTARGISPRTPSPTP